MRSIDLDSWKRKDHFLFFNSFDAPFFDIVAQVECNEAYHLSKKENISFFLYYLYLSLKTVNSIVEFRIRIKDDKPVIYDVVHASPTVNRSDGTFGFSYLKYYEDFLPFYESAQKEIKKVQNESGLKPSQNNENVIHYTTIPWINFTGLSHARHLATRDSIPKISFGKLNNEGNSLYMPVSVSVNHALMDGYHVGLFFETYQKLLRKADF